MKPITLIVAKTGDAFLLTDFVLERNPARADGDKVAKGKTQGRGEKEGQGGARG